MAYVEKMTKRPIHELFDLVAGTSTGAILALASVCPNRKTEKPKPASDFSSIYKDNANLIFNRPSIVNTIITATASAALTYGFSQLSRFHNHPWNVPLALSGGAFLGATGYWSGRSLLVVKYDRNGLDGVLKNYFENETLNKLTTDVLIPTYSLGHREPWICDSSGDSSFLDFINLYQVDRLVRDIAAATSAAPSYFDPFDMEVREPAIVRLFKGKRILKFIDGGLAYNNPAYLAYVKAKKCWNSQDRIHLLSLGTGYWAESPNFNRGIGYMKGGKLLVAGATLDTLFQSQSLSCHRFLNGFAEKDASGDPYLVNYLRLDTQLPSELALDGVESVNELVKLGNEISKGADPFIKVLNTIK